MEGAAQGFCRPEHGARLSRTLELGRHPGACSSYALRGGARASGTESKPDSSGHRFAGRKGCPKGGLGSILRATTRQEEVDAMGLLFSAVVHPADVQDRDGAFQLLRRARRLLSFIERIADGGYAGSKMRSSSAHAGGCASSSVSMLPASRSCPNAGIVEQTFARISRNRRLARDFERYATTVVALVRSLLRRLAANTSA